MRACRLRWLWSPSPGCEPKSARHVALNSTNDFFAEEIGPSHAGIATGPLAKAYYQGVLSGRTIVSQHTSPCCDQTRTLFVLSQSSPFLREKATHGHGMCSVGSSNEKGTFTVTLAVFPVTLMAASSPNGYCECVSIFPPPADAGSVAEAGTSDATTTASPLAAASKGHYRAPPRPQWGRSIHVSPQ